MIPGWASWSYVFQCEALHYLLGFSVGLLTSSSILIIYRIGPMAFSLMRIRAKRPSTLTYSGDRWARAAFYILLFSLSASLVSHVLEDLWFSFF